MPKASQPLSLNDSTRRPYAQPISSTDLLLNLGSAYIRISSFTDAEKYRFMRTLELALVEYDDVQKYRDEFLVFIEEYDKRRDLNFDETFPEIAKFRDKE